MDTDDSVFYIRGDERLRFCRVERRQPVEVSPREAGMRHERLLVVLLALVPSVHAATSLAPRAAAAAQNPAVVEASLNVDQATRRLIQQELRNEGFARGRRTAWPEDPRRDSRWAAGTGGPLTQPSPDNGMRVPCL